MKRIFEISSELSLEAFIDRGELFEKVLYNKDFEVLKYISSLDGVILKDETLMEAIRELELNIVIYLLNFYLRQNTPSHLRIEIDIFLFSNNNTSGKNNENNINNIDNNLELFKRIFKETILKKFDENENRIWQEVSKWKSRCCSIYIFTQRNSTRNIK